MCSDDEAQDKSEDLPLGKKYRTDLEDSATKKLSGAHTDLCRAAYSGDHTRLLHLLRRSRGANVNTAQLPRRMTALHYAATMGHVSCGRLLIEFGANVNAFAHDMSTPLHLSAAKGRKEMVRLLLKHGAHRHIQTSLGLTPKDMADISHHKLCSHVLDGNATQGDMTTEQLAQWTKRSSSSVTQLPPISPLPLVTQPAVTDPKTARRSLLCQVWLDDLKRSGLYQHNSEDDKTEFDKENHHFLYRRAQSSPDSRTESLSLLRLRPRDSAALKSSSHSMLVPKADSRTESLSLLRLRPRDNAALKSRSHSMLVPKARHRLPPLKPDAPVPSRSLGDLPRELAGTHLKTRSLGFQESTPRGSRTSLLPQKR